MELEQLPEIQKIISIGKANSEITYDEINNILPEKLTNSDKIDDVFILLNQYGIEIIEEYDRKKIHGGLASKNELQSPYLNISTLAEKKIPAFVYDELKKKGYNIDPPGKINMSIQDLAIYFMGKGYDIEVLSEVLRKKKSLETEKIKKSGKEKSSVSNADEPVKLYLEEISKVSLISGSKEVELAKRIEVGENIIEDAILKSSLLRNSFIRYYPKVKINVVRIVEICRSSKTYYVSQKEKEDIRASFLAEMEKVIAIDKDIQALKSKLKRYTHRSKKHQDIWAQILKLENKSSEYMIKIGVSQKELSKYINKVKSMVFRIKEIKRHFLRLKEKYGHDVKVIKTFNRHIERNEKVRPYS